MPLWKPGLWSRTWLRWLPLALSIAGWIVCPAIFKPACPAVIRHLAGGGNEEARLAPAERESRALQALSTLFTSAFRMN